MSLHDSIIGIIADTLHVSSAELLPEKKLVDIAKDSITLFELLIRFEEVLNHKVSYEDIADIETIGDILAFISSLPPEVTARVRGEA